MWRTDPLLAETVRGLAGRGHAQRDWLLYLFLQALVVFVWWPKSTLREALAAGDGPDTLLAATLAAGFALAWFSARAGAEEVLLPGQHGLREWAAASALPLPRILAGYLAGHALHTLHLLALGAPLLLVALPVAGGEWGALGWCVAALAVQATGCRLAGAAVYLAIGQHGAMCKLCVRGVVLVGYAAAAAYLPVASHLRLCREVFGDAAPAAPAALDFMLVHGVACAALLGLLAWQLGRLRGPQPDAPGARA